MNLSTIIQQLYEIEAIKFGSFTLKSGATSPIYFDLRQIISHPKLLQAIADLMWDKVSALSIDLLCGVPYTAIPIATCLSLKTAKPMILVRKEVKTYGTKQKVEGRYQPGQSCLIIEDVVTSGSSILTTLADLQAAQLKVPYIVAFLDREQGGKEALATHGCRFFSVCTMSEILTELRKLGIAVPKEI